MSFSRAEYQKMLSITRDRVTAALKPGKLKGVHRQAALALLLRLNQMAKFNDVEAAAACAGILFGRDMYAFNLSAPVPRGARLTTQLLTTLKRRGLNAKAALRAIEGAPFQLHGFTIADVTGDEIVISKDGKESRIKKSSFDAAYSKIKR